MMPQGQKSHSSVPKDHLLSRAKRLASYIESVVPGGNSAMVGPSDAATIRSLIEQVEALEKQKHIDALTHALDLAEADPLYAEVFRPYFHKIMQLLTSTPASTSEEREEGDDA